MPNSLHVYGFTNRMQQVDHEKLTELNMRLNTLLAQPVKKKMAKEKKEGKTSN